jgi:hypothetical protein
MTPFVEFLDKLQEARDAIRLTYPPTRRTFIDEIGMRGAQDRQWYFVCIINLGPEHRLEIGGEAVLDETFVEPLGIGRNEREVVSDTDLVIAMSSSSAVSGTVSSPATARESSWGPPKMDSRLPIEVAPVCRLDDADVTEYSEPGRGLPL